MNGETDAQLVAAIVAGRRDAFAALYDRYAGALYDVAMSMLRDPHESADAVQDVFLIAAQRLHQLREPDRVRAWLFSVLRHDVYRRSAKWRRVSPTDTVVERAAPVMPEDAGGRLEYEDLARLVRDAAEGLDDRDRLVLELSVRQGLQGADLASALGVSPEQSYSLVFRMRERTERALGALVVARTNREACRDLDQLLRDWDGRFSVLVRKRVARHVDQCLTCESQRKKVGALAAFAVAPAWAVPLTLRDRVVSGFVPGASLPDSSAGGSPPESGSGEVTDPTVSATAPADRAAGVASPDVVEPLVAIGGVTATDLSWASDGFPGTPRAVRRGAVMLVAGIVVVLAVGVLGALALRDDEPSTLVAAATEFRDTTTSVGATPRAASQSTSSTSVDGPATIIAPTASSATTAGPTPTTVPGPAAPPATDRPPPTDPTVTTGPPTTASPPTTPPVTTSTVPPTTTRPGDPRLFVSPGRFDAGASATTAELTVRNDGAGQLTWSAAATAGPLRPEPTSGTLAPGASAIVRVAIDRSNQPEGAFTGTVAFGGNGGSATVTVVGRTERGPVIALATTPSPLVTLYTSATECSPTTAAISATVTDESAIGSVTLHWRGPGGVPGSSVPMTLRAGRYVATLGPFATGGALEWWVRAADSRGNVSTTPLRALSVGATCIR